MKRGGLILGFVAGIFFGSRPTAAQYTADFQTNIISGVTSNWIGDYVVGSNTFSDALLIQDSGVLSNGYGYLGYELGSSDNSVLVAGPGSTWSNRNDLTIGVSGTGNSLVISNGGLVRNLYSYMGYNSSSSGNHVLVSDSDSAWRQVFDMRVGSSGSGNSLVISNGAVVRDGAGQIGFNSSSSNNSVLVTGSSSVWSNGGLNGATTAVGVSGSGNSLVIGEGGAVYGTYGTIGSNTTAKGNSVLITGSGSIWSNSANVHIGFSGAANNLVISNGGQSFNGNLLSAGTVYVGYNSGSSNNSVIVTGTGSVWRVKSDTPSTSLIVGNSGASNRLVISDGGGAYNDDGYIGKNANSTNNSVVVSDAGSIWSNWHDAYIGYVGGSNSLAIRNGGRVLNRFGYVGYDTNSRSNSVTVNGIGSTWQNTANLYIGYSSASNSLVISGGGSVANTYGYIGSNTVAGGNSVLVTDGGSVWSNGVFLFVGASGPGNSLVISNGGYVYSGNGYIGNDTTAAGNSVVVDGSNSIWRHGGSLYVGYSGASNRLAISNGGLVNLFFSISGGPGPSYLGYNAGSSNNSALVSGTGAVWYTGDLYLGYSGRGNNLVIGNGGQVVCRGDPHIGYNSSSTNNKVLVSDAGSIWSNTSGIYVGYGSAGNGLVISNGGLVVSGNSFGSDSFVGYNPSSITNSVLITGADSTWRMNSSLYVGYSGYGNNLTVVDGGCVSNASSLYVGYASPGNKLAISNGGQVIDTDGYVGSSASSRTNTVRVVDGGVWQNNTLQVGYQGSSNSLVVAGGTVLAANLTVGAYASTCDNWVQLDSGSVFVTNANHDAVLEVDNGTFVQNGGVVQADILFVTNFCGRFVRNGGTLVCSHVVLDPSRSEVGDGVPNAWKQQYGLDPFDPNLANEDPDGDGMSNLQEYLTGTNPTNNASMFRIINIAREGDDIRVTWTGAGAGVVQASSDVNGTYSDISSNILLSASDTAVTNYLDVGGATNGPTRFYRVRQCSECAFPPLPPSGLTAGAVSAGRIDLSWTDNSGYEDGFKIERAPDNSGSPGSWTQIATVGLSVTTYRDTGVWPNTTYWYRVHAYNSGGDSEFSNVASANTPALCPASVVGWGYNGSGQGTPPADLINVVAIAAGANHSLALKSDGTVVGWGDNSSGQATSPVGLTNVVAIAAGHDHSLALKSDGTVVGWGDNSSGQATPPVGLTNVVAIAAGSQYSLALRSDGTVVGWSQEAPAGLSNVVAIAASESHSLALKSDGTVVGWGDVSSPQGLFGVVAIACGAYHNLAVKQNGTVVGWGFNDHGQATSPTGLAGVVAVAAGITHSLALEGDGTVVGWGDDYYGQSAVPAGLSNAVAIAANEYHSLALTCGPSTPLDLAAVAVSRTQIDLSWADNSANEDSFAVERATSDLGPWTEIGSVDSNVTTYSDTAAPCGQSYYRVRAYNVIGGSPYSNTATADTSIGDADCDGIPDSWMQGYFGHPTGQASDNSRASDDADGDAQNTLAEFLAGTDPTNSASVFRIIEIWPEDEDMFLTWTAVGGKWYVLQTTTGDIGSFSNDFVDLDMAFPAPGTGETNVSVLHLGAATNAPARFYRVRIVP